MDAPSSGNSLPIKRYRASVSDRAAPGHGKKDITVTPTARSNEAGSAARAPLASPFYFIIVLWGERYRDYFLDYCLPSLLAPRNIPALDTARRSKFLICTRPDDWVAIKTTAIFRALESHLDPVYVEIPACPPGRSGCEHMNIGHKLACDMAFRDHGLALILTPDCMISDGTMAHVQDLARNGARLVLTAALRFGEEPFLGGLRSQGLISSESRRDSGQPLTITGRQMVHAAINGFHSETLSYEWDAPYLLPVTPAAWWRVPGEDGVVLHSLSWAPLLIDYSAVKIHDTSTLDGWTIDGDYLYRNLGDAQNIHIVQDSDEIFLASWAPMADRSFVARPIALFNGSIGRKLFKAVKGLLFKSSFYSPVFDPIRRRAFGLTVRWHSRSLNQNWDAVEKQALDELQRWVELAGVKTSTGLASVLGNIAIAPIRGFSIVWLYRQAIGRRLRQALTGDMSAIRRILWNLRRERALLMHRMLKESAPPPPGSSAN
jgi:hypothetical protein